MKILAVTSLYPPHYLGGYELACAEIVGHLAARGHQVQVLTSAHRLPGREAASAPDEDRVRRRLSFLPWIEAQSERIGARARREARDHAVCRQVLSELRPDVISVWDLWGLSPSLLATLGGSGAPLTYAVSSPWPLDLLRNPDRWSAFWHAEGGSGIKKAIKRTVFAPWRGVVDRWMPTARVLPDLRRSVFFSRALKQQHADGGYVVEDAPVVYHGIDLDLFPVQRFPSAEPATRLLFAGRLTPEKGVHTVLEAMALLRQDALGARAHPGHRGAGRRSAVRPGAPRASRARRRAGGGAFPSAGVPRRDAGAVSRARRAAVSIGVGGALCADPAGGDGVGHSGGGHPHRWEPRNPGRASDRPDVRQGRRCRPGASGETPRVRRRAATVGGP